MGRRGGTDRVARATGPRLGPVRQSGSPSRAAPGPSALGPPALGPAVPGPVRGRPWPGGAAFWARLFGSGRKKDNNDAGNTTRTVHCTQKAAVRRHLSTDCARLATPGDRPAGEVASC